MNLGTTVGLTMGKATRDAFGDALRTIGSERPDLFVVDGDVGNSTRTGWFGEDHPDRFFNVGIAESNLIGVAAGLAASGKTVVAASFAAFLLCNAFDQIRMGIAFPRLNVKLVGSHAGISIGEDGPSQMGVEDVALACTLPGFAVVVPSDEHQTRSAVHALIDFEGPAYLRVGRPAVPQIYSEGFEFELGKAVRVRDGSDVTLIANGIMVAAALDAAEQLSSEGVSARVVDMPTVKPIDEDAILAAARDTAGIVVAEEHLHHGGLGAAVAMVTALRHPCPMRFVDLKDSYATSGDADALLEHFGLTGHHVASAAREILGR